MLNDALPAFTDEPEHMHMLRDLVRRFIAGEAPPLTPSSLTPT